MAEETPRSNLSQQSYKMHGYFFWNEETHFVQVKRREKILTTTFERKFIVFLFFLNQNTSLNFYFGLKLILFIVHKKQELSSFYLSLSLYR